MEKLFCRDEGQQTPGSLEHLVSISLNGLGPMLVIHLGVLSDSLLGPKIWASPAVATSEQ